MLTTLVDLRVHLRGDLRTYHCLPCLPAHLEYEDLDICDCHYTNTS